MYECFHCLHKSLVWQSDYSYDDFGYEGEGIVQILHCANCGAEVEYRIDLDVKETKEEDKPTIYDFIEDDEDGNKG